MTWPLGYKTRGYQVWLVFPAPETELPFKIFAEIVPLWFKLFRPPGMSTEPCYRPNSAVIPEQTRIDDQVLQEGQALCIGPFVPLRS